MASFSKLLGNAAVAARSIVWLGNLDEQQKNDILHSTLFAQAAADAKYPVDDEEKASQWHGEFVNILGNIGWVIKKFDDSSLDTTVIEGSVADAVLDNLKVDKDVDKELYASVARVLIDLLRTGDSSEAEAVLDTASIASSAHFAGVQIAVAGIDDGSPALTLFGYFYSAVGNIGTALWHPIPEDSTELTLKRFFVQMTLNESVYSGVRDSIIKRLEEADKIRLIIPLCQCIALSYVYLLTASVIGLTASV